MSDKKPIDRLFQEKFKNFEATPSDSVWNNISTELQSRKKDKKGIPIWWRVAGVAATLLLMFTLGKLMQNNHPATPLNEIIVDVDSNKDNDLQDVINKENNVSEDLETNSLNISSDNSIINTVTNSPKNNNTTKESKNKNITVIVEKQNANTTSINKSEALTTSNKTKNAIVAITPSELSQEKTQNNNIDKAKSDAVLNKDNNTKEVTKITLVDTVLNKDAVELEDSIAIIKEEEEEEKLSLTEEVAIIEVGNTEGATDEKFERWSASSNIAPVYFNTLGKGSSIHPQFSNNSKTGNINMSYGISGSYAINKKLSVRAGVNKVNLGYSTNDVLVFINANSSGNPQLLRNVEFNQTGQNMSFASVEVFNFAQAPAFLNDFIESSIDQKLGFIEIPLELEYKISNKRIGINIIGGFSALFLSDNEIYSVLDGNTTLLGKATNINNTSFSANFGLGFNFKVAKKLNFNLEPVFKYQLNTFNNTSGRFQPYFIGVYSGLSFKF